MLIFIALVILAVPVSVYLFFKNPQFGARISEEEKERFAKSPQWDGQIFLNQSPTSVSIPPTAIPKLLRETIRGRKHNVPQQDLPIHPFDKGQFQLDGTPKFAWFGHSALLLQLGNKNLLIDPMLGPDASPVGPIRTGRFSKNALSIIDQLPKLDAILMTHDHYDHLDYKSILALKDKTSVWLVALGVKRHLTHWGIAAEQITEFDWWQTSQLDHVKLTFTPSRHFSGRGLSDRAKSLWGGWVFDDGQHKIYWSGDGGYDAHFKTIGEKLGPFDWGFIECGQYNERWHQIHLMPEEAVQAAIEARVQQAIPVHWGAFNLSLHHWKEPAERFTERSKQLQVDYLTPELGEVVTWGDQKDKPWWENY